MNINLNRGATISVAALALAGAVITALIYGSVQVNRYNCKEIEVQQPAKTFEGLGG